MGVATYQRTLYIWLDQGSLTATWPWELASMVWLDHYMALQIKKYEWLYFNTKILPMNSKEIYWEIIDTFISTQHRWRKHFNFMNALINQKSPAKFLVDKGLFEAKKSLQPCCVLLNVPIICLKISFLFTSRSYPLLLLFL